MNRDNAVVVFKEVLNVSEGMGSNSFHLTLSDKNDLTSKGYQIRISMPKDEVIRQRISNLAKTYNLEVKEEEGETIIYEPKTRMRL